MNNYLNFYAAHQLHGSANAPIGIILCNAGRENGSPFALMNLPNKVMIVQPDKGNDKQDVVGIDPNAKIY
ncbi:MAG: hypothetical protein EAZ62_02425 [Sphingobacteriia bacterium]|nr:MAG: hypothetical protein EAZ62_02425 [Sphingobacteriia bacterium]